MRTPLRAASLMLVVAVSSYAQAPAGSDKLTPQAVAESLKVLHQLDSIVTANPKDAAAWFHRGMIGFALYERDRTKPPISGLDWTRLGRLADTSFRIATEYAPTNGEYGLWAGRYLLYSGVSITRAASYGYFDAALEAARKESDPHILAETAIEAGRVQWRRYDTFADRETTVGDAAPVGITGAIGAPGKISAAAINSGRGNAASEIREQLAQNVMPVQDGFFGEPNYLRAEDLFREAFSAEPSNERAYRQFAMLLVEKNRWRELEVMAHTRLDAAPRDAWAWLTLGLAMHRQRKEAVATAAAFDSAFALLPADERARLDNLERVLNPADTTRIKALPPAVHASMQRLYWTTADPLWSRQGNEPRVEFLARVTYAELRWTVDELKVRGADTDRGDVYIRFGPPDLKKSFKSDGGAMSIGTQWAYNFGLAFYFEGNPTFATARIPPGGQADFYDGLRSIPVSWANINPITVDSMPVQVARFRTHDSVDVFVAALAPVEAIAKAADVAGPVREDFWLLDANLVSVARDSAFRKTSGIRTFTNRIAQGLYLFRVEASGDGARYAARASAAITARRDSSGFTPTGFGISDVLVATKADARNPKRWSDYTFTPLVGSAVKRSQLTLIWENYELGAVNGSARYSVTLLLQREHTAVGRIAMQITGALARSVGVQRADDQITMQFERSMPVSPTIVDNIALSLGDSPAGTYRLTLTVTDHITGRTTARTMPFAIRP